MKKAMKLAALISAAAMMSGMLLPLPVSMEIPAAITASAEDDEEYTEGSISSLYYAKYSDHVAITGFESDRSTFEIPETIEGLPVTCIDTGAFAGSTLTGITIPKTVTTIKDWAFSTCLDLKSITLPDSVDYIGAQAFDLCTSLNNVELPDHFVRIENEAFTGTPWIEKLRSQ
ncbi:MAG: leucine-rich repeat domain-containing protein, partial [Oscillospiraceae bacterium]|nr:leucine-rich repeat domain-containing protein [Oscillospiraceae bacterium]